MLDPNLSVDELFDLYLKRSIYLTEATEVVSKRMKLQEFQRMFSRLTVEEADQLRNLLSNEESTARHLPSRPAHESVESLLDEFADLL